MNDPKRLLDGAGSDVELMLLRAAVDEEPPFHGKHRLGVALGLAAVLKTTTAAASTTSAFVAKGAALLGMVVAVGLGTYFVARAPEARRAPVQVSAPAAVLAPAPQQPPLAEMSSELPSAAPEPSAKRAAPVHPTIAAEIAALDGVRAALRSDSSSALRLLGRYQRQFPRGALRQEAFLLRIEALVKAGDREGAHQLAQKFLNANPSSPHAHRVRSLVGLRE